MLQSSHNCKSKKISENPLNTGWCPRRCAGVFSLGILGSTGCRSSTQGPAAKSQVFKLRCLQRLGCERCHLRQQRRSEGDVDFRFNSPGSWATLALNHQLLHKRIQNASWETCVLVLKSDSQWIPRCPKRRPPHSGAGTSPAEEDGKL
ncbi:Universal stress protein E [Frankliniella fusca]|uniref:Universal stress protein E n=1 Tax=Frankliniella fusca TaxID=407009 RepID=A0AAE1LRG7_9NEOP|nr:Universal stress protein E [Frankliniella fusca]